MNMNTKASDDFAAQRAARTASLQGRVTIFVEDVSR
jgi:hypothetical protein